MDKMMKNAGLKCAAAIILSVSLVALAISSVLGLYFFDRGVFDQVGRDTLYQDRVESIAWDYYAMAIDYYATMVRLIDEDKDETEIEQRTRGYKDMFSEDKCNYAFYITPVDEEDKEKYPSLSNYSCDDYQFTTSWQEGILISEEWTTFTYPIPAWYIEMENGGGRSQNTNAVHEEENLTTEIEYQTESYEDEEWSTVTEAVALDGYYEDDYYGNGYDYYAYEANGDFWITNDNVRYNLTKDAGYQKAWKAFCDQYGADANISTDGFGYNGETGEFYQDVYVSKIMTVDVQQYVKSEFTASDDFQNSLFLRYVDVIIDATIPVWVISLIFAVLCSIYLVAASGHRKGMDEIVLNGFDRIPFDILFAFICLGCLSWLYVVVMYRGYNTVNETGLIILGCVGLMVFVPPVLMTTATRIKVSGWRLFQNTVIWKMCCLAWRLLKWIWRKCVGVVSYLIHHMNLYWKYVGVLVIFGLIELLAAATDSMGVVLVIGLIEFLILCMILIRALVDMNMLKKGAEELASGNTDYEIDTSHMMWEFKHHGENLNRIKDGIQVAVEDRMKSERMKTELITNVSHDIKTPLTSIISYVDLLKKEQLDNRTALEYVEVLDRQSARLKKLIQDLIDASKASTGNLNVHLEETNIRVLLEQAMGEFTEKMEKRGLRTVITYNTEPVTVMADGQHLWRIFQNIINNIEKYAQDNTRVYIDVDGEILQQDDSGIVKRNNMLKVTFKNISRDALNVSGDELMERFVRGDSSRNTEGSGLGLSIARSLAELQGGNLEIIVDGDLFKVVLLLVRA